VKILILVADEKERSLINSSLDDLDLEIVEAQGDVDIPAVVDQYGNSVIIADFADDKNGGWELVNHILASNLEEYPFIIFMVEKEQEKQAIECLGPIPGDYLLRPLEGEELRLRLEVAERTLAMQTRLQGSSGQSESLALYDQLTGVLNRQAVYERALAELSRAQREHIQVVIAMVEVKNLEQIREEFGPEIRDQVVRFVARVARANLRLYDLVGRWIGAKFLLMLPGVDQENAGPIFQRIHTSVTTIRVRATDSDRVALDVRIGYSLMDVENPQPLYELIEQANHALEEAITSKKDQVIMYQPDEV